MKVEFFASYFCFAFSISCSLQSRFNVQHRMKHYFYLFRNVLVQENRKTLLQTTSKNILAHLHSFQFNLDTGFYLLLTFLFHYFFYPRSKSDLPCSSALNSSPPQFLEYDQKDQQLNLSIQYGSETYTHCLHINENVVF